MANSCSSIGCWRIGGNVHAELSSVRLYRKLRRFAPVSDHSLPPYSAKNLFRGFHQPFLRGARCNKNCQKEQNETNDNTAVGSTDVRLRIVFVENSPALQ